MIEVWKRKCDIRDFSIEISLPATKRDFNSRNWDYRDNRTEDKYFRLCVDKLVRHENIGKTTLLSHQKPSFEETSRLNVFNCGSLIEINNSFLVFLFSSVYPKIA